jgi:hypothetical protein
MLLPEIGTATIPLRDYVEAPLAPEHAAILRPLLAVSASVPSVEQVSQFVRWAWKIGDNPEEPGDYNGIQAVLARSLPLLEQGLQGNLHQAGLAFDGLFTLMWQYRYFETSAQAAVAIADSHLPVILDLLNTPYANRAFYYLLMRDYHDLNGWKGEEPPAAMAWNLLKTLDQSKVMEMIRPLPLARDLKWFRAWPYEKLLSCMFDERITQDIVDSWTSNFDDDDAIQTTMWPNMVAMLELERLSPGLPSDFFRQSGIANYTRYPIEALASQLTGEHKSDGQRILWVTSRHDATGAFVRHKQLLTAVYEAICTSGSLVMLEFTSPKELMRLLNQTLDRYGTFDDVFFNVHSTQGRMIRSYDPRQGEYRHISQVKLVRSVVPELEKILSDTGILHLNTCDAPLMKTLIGRGVAMTYPLGERMRMVGIDITTADDRVRFLPAYEELLVQHKEVVRTRLAETRVVEKK